MSRAFTLAEGGTHAANFAGSGKNAFTLVEVLITLGIIGVVAAMTLPTLINKTHNKELQTAFLKTYSELNQVAELYVADNGISVAEESAGNNGQGMPANIANKIFGYYKGSKQMGQGQVAADEQGNFTPFYAMNSLNGNAFSGGTNAGGADSSFLCDNTSFLNNLTGALMILNDRPILGQNGPVICVDVNGKKGPNRFGLDYFLFIFTVDGRVLPMGQAHKNNPNRCTAGNGVCSNFSNVGPEFCSNTASNYTYNTSCAYYALTNTHPTEPGKDYWNDFVGEVYKR